MRQGATLKMPEGNPSNVKAIRPEGTEPIPVRASPHRVGTILIRFVGMLLLVIVVLMLIWSR